MNMENMPIEKPSVEIEPSREFIAEQAPRAMVREMEMGEITEDQEVDAAGERSRRTRARADLLGTFMAMSSVLGVVPKAEAGERLRAVGSILVQEASSEI